MRNLSLLILVFIATFVAAEDKVFSYSEKSGYILWYPLPADDLDRCDLKSVVSSKPFVKVRYQQAAGVGNDAIVIEEWPALSLYELRELSMEDGSILGKLKDGLNQLKKGLENLAEDVTNFLGRFDLLGNKAKVVNKKEPNPEEIINARIKAVKDSYAAKMKAPKILDTIYFSTITGFAAPDKNKGRGVCQAFKGFSTTDLVYLYNLAKIRPRIR